LCQRTESVKPDAKGSLDERNPVNGYRPELDVVRCLAFFLVFAHHFLLLTRVCVSFPCPSRTAGLDNERLFIAFRDLCSLGLCLFFCLSGYLINCLLLDERERNGLVSVRKFYIRRVLRIWPLYFLGIIIGTTIAILLHQKEEIIGFIWFLFFAGNFYPGRFNNPMLPLWSISIEEQFYLIWPWILRWVSHKGLFACVGLLFVVANATLFILGQHHVDPGRVAWGNTFVQFEMFASGILLALLRKPAPVHRPLLGFALAFTGLVIWFISCFLFHPNPVVGTETAVNGAQLIAGYGFIALGCAAILQGFCMIGPTYMPRALINLGRISYGLYVYHVLVSEITLALVNPGNRFISIVLSGILSLFGTICVAAISYAYLERPFLKMKRRFEVLHTRPV
jgi:peptidoglycan/LPS O-acetylase OafA/YrhL